MVILRGSFLINYWYSENWIIWISKFWLILVFTLILINISWIEESLKKKKILGNDKEAREIFVVEIKICVELWNVLLMNKWIFD